MELKRRTRVARVFPNEASLLRLISALLTTATIGKPEMYLNMENQTRPQFDCSKFTEKKLRRP